VCRQDHEIDAFTLHQPGKLAPDVSVPQDDATRGASGFVGAGAHAFEIPSRDTFIATGELLLDLEILAR
jgi:hypothetical protein